MSVTNLTVMQPGQDEHTLVLDAFSVVTLLSEEFFMVFAGNTSTLMTIVYALQTTYIY